jgi:hypothetical protein
VTGGELSKEALGDDVAGGEGGQDGLPERTRGAVVGGDVMGSGVPLPPPPPRKRRTPFIANKENEQIQ